MKTRDKIIELAQDMSMASGFNGFSYRDISEKLGIKPAAIHYHFPKKDDLGIAIAREYYDADLRKLAQSEKRETPAERLQTFKSLFIELINRRRLCLFAIVSTNQNKVPAEMLEKAEAFSIYAPKWLTKTLETGVEKNDFTLLRSPLILAKELFAISFGTLIFTYSSGDAVSFDKIYENWIKGNIF